MPRSARGSLEGAGPGDDRRDRTGALWDLRNEPGHSVGFTVFRFATGGHSYLVCGHAIGQTAGADGWASGVHPLMAETALRSLHVLRDLDVDYLLPDRTRRDPEPPLPFGPSERAPITEKVRAYLVKKHRLPPAS